MDWSQGIQKVNLLFIGQNLLCTHNFQNGHHNFVSPADGRKETVVYPFKFKGMQKEEYVKNHRSLQITIL